MFFTHRSRGSDEDEVRYGAAMAIGRVANANIYFHIIYKHIFLYNANIYFYIIYKHIFLYNIQTLISGAVTKIRFS